MPPITPAAPNTTISRFENKEDTPAPASTPVVSAGPAKVDVVENFYQKAKALYECLGREPRHAQLESAYVEMGLALKEYEASIA